MPSLLELHIQILLNGFPNGVTVGANDHCAANRTVICQFGIGDDVEVPRVEVLRAGRDDSLRDSALRVLDSVLGLRRRTLGGEGGSERARAEVVAPPQNRRRTASDGGGRGRGEEVS